MIAKQISQEYLSYENCPATSYVAAMFHPTKGPCASLISQQRCHPRAGHDSPRNKEIAGLHITKDNNTTRIHSSTKPTQ